MSFSMVDNEGFEVVQCLNPMSHLPGVKFSFPHIGAKQESLGVPFKKVWASCNIIRVFLRNGFCVCFPSI